MVVRKSVIPKNLLDFVGCFVRVFIFIPFLYWFQLYTILPYHYPNWDKMYITHWILTTFVAYNIFANCLAMLILDTSINVTIMPKKLNPGWRFCIECKKNVPPRSWHCASCQICILNRDHHCIYTGYCIGHRNSRYYLLFLLYTWITLAYFVYMNHSYIWNNLSYEDLTFRNIISPLKKFLFQKITDQIYVHFLIYVVEIGTLVLTFGLFVYQCFLIADGKVAFEKNKNLNGYDLGVIDNFKNVFGKKWYFSWISPTVSSELPQDGVNWKKIGGDKGDKNKLRKKM